jgi:glycosyltransferase involved in cell wall biosynthesis
VVNYGTRRAEGSAEAQREAFFQRFPHLRGKRLLLFLSRIHPKKGCDLAIRAFSAVLARRPDWHLVVAGPDQVGLRPALAEIAEESGVSARITWAGMLTGDAKSGAFRAAEVFLLPSHQENFGIAVSEALAHGLPVLISNKVNIWREVQADEGGLVGEDDLAGTCELLRTWETMPESQKGLMREAALKCFCSRFEIGLAAKSLMDVLSNIVGCADGRHRVHA